MEHCPLRAQLIHLWQIIHKYSYGPGCAFFGREYLAEIMGVSIRTVQRWINALREKRLVWVIRTGRSSEYRLVTPPVENLCKVTPDEPEVAHRIKDELESPSIPGIVGSEEAPAVDMPEEKVAAPAATLPKLIPTEQFLDLWRQEKQRGGLAHARDAVKNILDRLNLPPKLRDS